MKSLPCLSSVAVAAILAWSNAAASAQTNLAQAADALEDSLKSLDKELSRRGDGFREDGKPLFRALEKARDDADKIAKSAGEDFSPRFAISGTIDKLKEHVAELWSALERVNLTRDERKTADAVSWNMRTTLSFWSRYNPGAAPAISGEEKARRIAVNYLVAKYRPPQSALRIDAVSRTGDDFLVFATIGNRTSYRLIVSPRQERVLTESVIYPNRPPQPFTDAERARTYATRYLTDKYQVAARELDLGKTTDLGKFFRVLVKVKGVGLRAVDVDPRSGRIIADRQG